MVGERRAFTFYPPLIGSLYTRAGMHVSALPAPRLGMIIAAFVHTWTLGRARLARLGLFSRSGILVFFVLVGANSWNPLMATPPEITEEGVQPRRPSPPASNAATADGLLPPDAANDRDPVLGDGKYSEEKPLSLADAIAFAQRNSPRLKAARAHIERSSGQQQAAFAAFLPEIDLAFQSGGTSDNQGPGAPGPTGFILTDGALRTHSYVQGELQLLWTLYDFGRRAGRYRQAAARHRMTQIQLVRADQSVQFDVAVAYLNILLARASLLVQEDAIRQSEATLQDARALLEGGVADRDDVLRAEVQLSESRDAFVSAQEAELVAIAQLNNVMGRNAALPLRVLDLKLPPRKERPSLGESLRIATVQRPEINFVRQAVVAALEGVRAAKAAFLPKIHVRASTGQVEGAHVLTGWQAGAGLHVEVPLYTGGLLEGELRAAKAEVAAAVADAQTVLDAISLEVTQAFQNEVAAGRRVELSRTAVVEAQENLRLMRVKYRNGDATPTDIVDAEAALTRAQQRLNSAVFKQMAALSGLDYAMGRQQGTILRQAERLRPRKR